MAAFALGSNLSRLFPQEPTKPAVGAPPTNTKRAVAQAATSTATATLPTATRTPTPLASLTPSRTLKPPPTLEPPTATVLPSNTPVPSVTPTLDLSVNIPGLISGETNTPVATGGCTPRKDWKLTYTVQHGDALARIAELYGTTVDALVKGNCLSNANVIVTGQVLKVPGTVQPSAVRCIPFDVLTPFNGTTNVAGGGNITFDWHGPFSPKTLIRVIRPDNTIWEDVVELRHNDTVDAYANFNAGGTYRWYLYPLDGNYVQNCPEGGPYYFTKSNPPTQTPTPKLGP
jgi:LysM repeat protein